MDHFNYIDGQLHCEKVNLDDLASEYGTPLYVYSAQTFIDHYKRVASAFAPLDPVICYSIKSCGNLHLIKLLASLGSGMDVVSGGELHRAKLAGASMKKVVYAGVGKTDPEIRDAIEAGIAYFNIESEAEFENIAQIAQSMGAVTHGALRVNPDVSDPKTHAKTTTGKKETKFGVDIDRARHFFEVYGKDARLKLTGIHLHIGSPIYSAEPYKRAIEKAMLLIDDLKAAGFDIKAINIGGGYAADYVTGASPAAADYANEIVPLLQPFKDAGGQVFLEPGRSIAANAGVLLSRVQYIKLGGVKKFVILDAGMNDLIRPAMYDAFHFVWPTNVAPAHVPANRSEKPDIAGLEQCDIVGPICETGDAFAKDRPLPPVARGDLMCVFSAGAYGMAMASNYNAFPKPAEILVEAGRARVIRRRETYDDLVGPELETQTG